MAASRTNHLTGVAMAAALAGSMLLAGCGEHHMAPAHEASAAMDRPDALAGAPADAAAPAPPMQDVAPPSAPPARPGDTDVVYDLGPVVHGRDTMAPIANPPERARASRGRMHGASQRTHAPGRHGHTHHGRAQGMATRSRHDHTARHASPPHAMPRHAAAFAAHPAPGHATAPTAHRPAAPAHGAATRTAPTAPAPAHKSTPAAHEATPLAVKPATPHKAAAHGAHAGKAQVSAERTAKLSALQTALKDAVARTAVLSAHDLKADQPADVTLTLPADFASMVRDEAGKQGLQDASASVNVTALLAGDGYAVAPDEVQAQPLTVGQPTEFHWTVTAQPGAKGALRAQVGADLLGGGDEALQLGEVTPSSQGGFHVNPRVWGAGLLVLLAVIVFAWLGRSRGSAGRNRARTVARPYDRPLDMGTGSRPTPPPNAPFDREP